jgi:hypothetical protein
MTNPRRSRATTLSDGSSAQPTRAGATRNWNGPLFLEVFFDGHWQLLNATEMRLHDDYDPVRRILPGNRYASDKGSDPFQLVLSGDWERWKIQTTTYFTNFDLSKLPLGPGREVDRDQVIARHE